MIVLYITIMQTQPSTGCVINGGTHTHVYGAYHAEQQAKISELSANVSNLVNIVDRLTKLVAHCCEMQQPKPEAKPEPEPTPVPLPTYEPPANMYTPESDSESESEPDYNSDLEESDSGDPDQPMSEEQARLLEELQDISSARAQLRHSGASKSKFLKLNALKCAIHTKLYSHRPRPSTPELMEELVSPPTQNP
jgi:hypothetical protein